MSLIAWGIPSGGEWIVLAIFGLLLFGKRLPEVGRSIGKGIVEFKKGLRDVEDEINVSSDPPAAPPAKRELVDQKFDPYSGKPLPNPDHKFDPYTGKPVNAQVSSSTDSPAHVPPAST